MNALVWQKLKVAVAVASLATGLFGFAVGQWTSADAREAAKPSAALPHPPVAVPPLDAAPPPAPAAARIPAPAAPNEAKPPAAIGRRQTATVRVPSGTFVKEVDVPPYGTGRITWTYEEDRVTGLIEAPVMGVEVEEATDAEFSLSSNGAIYGVLNGVRINHVRFPAGGDLVASCSRTPRCGRWLSRWSTRPSPTCRSATSSGSPATG